MNDIKRVIITVCGLIILLFLAYFVKNSIDVHGWKTAYKYNIAIQATEKDRFNYDIDSKQGLVITRGVFTAKNGTKFPEMTKEYVYVNKVHEHYTMHTSTTCSENHCTTHVYYSWDQVGSEDRYAPKVWYLEREYRADLFSYGNMVTKANACSMTAKSKSGFFQQKHGCDKGLFGDEYYYEDDNDRYYYEVVPLKFTATFLSDTSSGTLTNPFGGQILLENKEIDKVKEDVNSYQFTNNIILIFISILIIISISAIGYQWVFSDGQWSSEE